MKNLLLVVLGVILLIVGTSLFTSCEKEQCYDCYVQPLYSNTHIDLQVYCGVTAKEMESIKRETRDSGYRLRCTKK